MRFPAASVALRLVALLLSLCFGVCFRIAFVICRMDALRLQVAAFVAAAAFCWAAHRCMAARVCCAARFAVLLWTRLLLAGRSALRLHSHEVVACLACFSWQRCCRLAVCSWLLRSIVRSVCLTACGRRFRETTVLTPCVVLRALSLACVLVFSSLSRTLQSSATQVHLARKSMVAFFVTSISTCIDSTPRCRNS